ncbi:CDP-diacylglycerol diphosphatase [Oryzifoliimicrobium ureilyticus]|uniref:CDP-diacylglycerol diphosphatase n=1 Tax=Oryzifoliimicrobium ureilyticus TaxID=3113724 RepID=UPI0030762C15
MSFSSRSALAVVLKSCEISYRITGAAFPCLKMVEAPSPLDSYAILREPSSEGRTIFTPLASVRGVEDPRLLKSDAPNYFAMAWGEISAVLPANRDRWDDAALAINAAVYRTQDHLHIHLGCINPDVRHALSPRSIGTGAFARMTVKLERQTFWARFVPGDDLERINPFKMVAEGVPGARANMGGATIAVIGGRSADGGKGFYLLATVMSNPPKSLAAAETLLDPTCGS